MKINIICFLIVILTSCGKSKHEIQLEQKNKQSTERKDAYSKYNQEKSNLNTKYNITHDWDSLIYTYQKKEKYLENNNLLNFEGSIVDITKSDSTYFMTLISGFRPLGETRNMAIISMTKQEFDEVIQFIPKPDKYYYISECSMIIQATKFSCKTPILRSEISQVDESPDIQLFFDSEVRLSVVEGVFIDCCFLELPSSTSKLTQ